MSLAGIDKPMARHGRALYLGILKLVIAAILVWLALRKIDFARAFALLGAQSFGLDFFALGLLFLQAVLSAWRWVWISRRTAAPLSFRLALKFFMLSLFYNQALPSFLPGDACRVWGAARGAAVRQAALGVVLDRLVTLMALLSLASLSLGLFVFRGRLVLGLGLGLVGAVLLAALAALAIQIGRSKRVFSLLPEKLARPLAAASDGAAGLVFSARFFGLLLFSFLIHGLSIATFFVLGQAMHLPFTALDAIMAAPLMLVMALIPISVNGWGVREGTAVFLLARFGIARTEAATLSVLFGLAQLALGLIGGLFVLFPSGGADAKASPGVRDR